MENRFDTYTIINRRPMEAFPEGSRFYDEGIADFEAGNPMKAHSSRSYKDGWRDASEASVDQ